MKTKISKDNILNIKMSIKQTIFKYDKKEFTKITDYICNEFYVNAKKELNKMYKKLNKKL